MAGAIPITVLGGYLGAGKTTLLNDVLAHAGGRRIAVVVNDFGELGVDAALLGGGGADGVVDLPNGCICCTLGTDLGVALEALASRERRPDHIVIEASGVADPAALAAWGTVPGFSPAGTLVLAAADSVRSRSADRYVGQDVMRQLRSGDLVVVTKTDLVPRARVEEVRSWLGSITDAPVVLPPDPPSDLVLAGPASSPNDVAATAVRERTARPEPEPSATRPEPDPTATHADRYVRWSWYPPAGGRPPSTDAVRRFVDALPAEVIRAKGLLPAGAGEVVEVQVVGASRSVVRTSGALPRPGIVAIGAAGDLDLPALDRLAELHLG